MSDQKAPPHVLDPRQLARIEAVHRGFLYQHLYSAAALLRAAKAGVTAIVVETDEDVEIIFPDRRLYVQVKTRSAPLGFSDLESAMERFDSLREEHLSGQRQGTAAFAFASNVAPGAALLKQMAETGWPSDVSVHWPETSGRINDGLPRPWPDILQAFEAISLEAASLPFGKLAPDTLVWKLSGCIQAAAAGIPPRADHAFRVGELTALFEQIVAQLQDFPSPPIRYRAQANEPPLMSGERVRIVSGFSGAGKTSWAAQAAIHTTDTAVYFNVGDVPSPALASAVSRELAGQLFGRKGSRLGEVLLPGANPGEILFAINRLLEQGGERATLVIDNAHSVSSADLRALIGEHSQLSFVLLCQPTPVVQELEVRLGVTAETLQGWSTETIATEGHALGCQGDLVAYDRLHTVTGGLPLYALNALQIVKLHHAGDVARFCAEIEAQTHLTATAQELILRRVFDDLAKTLREVAGALSQCDSPLHREEVVTLLELSFGLDAQASASALRSLRAVGFVQLFGSSDIKLHDAVRLVAKNDLLSRGNDSVLSVQQNLKNILISSLPKAWSLQKVSQLLRLFVALSEIKPLVEMVTDELFHEMGFMPEISAFLERSVESTDTSPEDCFWALDGLVFGALKRGDESKVEGWLEKMSALIDENNLGVTEKLAASMKRMAFAARHQRVEDVQAAMDETAKWLPDNPEHLRIARYNYAHAMLELGMFEECVTEMGKLIPEYYAVLGITPQQIFMRNPPEIWSLISKSSRTRDDLKHLADCLDLLAKAMNAEGHDSGLSRIQAMKFYAMANAVDSIIRVGQDLVDEFIRRRDYEGARDVIEKNLLPNVTNLKIASRIIPVRSQYAVVLAYCGDFSAADHEMARLAPYEDGLDEWGRWELRNQRRFISDMKENPPPSWQSRLAQTPVRTKKPRVNDPCPCGSGKKFKKCHGRR